MYTKLLSRFFKQSGCEILMVLNYDIIWLIPSFIFKMTSKSLTRLARNEAFEWWFRMVKGWSCDRPEAFVLVRCGLCSLLFVLFIVILTGIYSIFT